MDSKRKELFEKWANRAAIVAAQDAKRRLERLYDQLSDTKVVKKLKTLPKAQKILVGLGLYAAGIPAEERLPDDNPVALFVKEILTDAPAEIARRVINGETKIDHAPPQIQTTEISAEEKLIDIALEMGEEERKELTAWLSDLTPEERVVFIQRISSLAPQKITKLFQIDPDSREKLLAILAPIQEILPKQSSEPSPLTKSLDNTNTTLETWLENKRRQRQERRVRK